MHLPDDPEWPAAEEAGDDRIPRRRRTDRRPNPSEEPPKTFEPSLLEGLDLFGAGLPDDEEEGYTPPPAPPFPPVSRTAILALLAITGGLVLFFWPALLPIPANLTLLLGFGGVLGGFVTLVWRLRPDDDEDQMGPDHGAQV